MPLTVNVTNAVQIQRTAGRVESLDILVNNSAVDLHDDLSDRAGMDRHLAACLGTGHIEWRGNRRTSSRTQCPGTSPMAGAAVWPKRWNGSSLHTRRRTWRKVGDALNGMEPQGITIMDTRRTERERCRHTRPEHENNGSQRASAAVKIVRCARGINYHAGLSS